jgi:hypothetical protein
MDSSRFAPVLGGCLLLITVAVGAAIGCSNYVPPDVANYGPPNGLGGKTVPVPADDDAGSGSGTTPPAGGAYACVTAGGSLVDAGCSVSWSNDIYPKMESGGAWDCGSSACHGVTPPVLATSSHDYYVALANYTAAVASGTGAGEPYINPCSTDPTKSDFVCNTKTTGYCGTQPMPLGLPIASAGLAELATWVACGAPEN